MRQRVLITCSHCLRQHSWEPHFFDLADCEAAAARGQRYLYCRNVHPVRLDRLAVEVTLTEITERIFQLDDLAMQHQIGQGGYATVFKALWDQRVPLLLPASQQTPANL